MVTVRQATPADRPAVSAVLAEAWWRHGTSAMEDQIALLHGGVTSMAFSRGHCTALLGFSVREPAGEPVEIWADLVSLAVSGGQTPAKILRALLDGALESLQAKSVTGLVCLTGDDWLRSALSEVGFLETDRVIGYVRSGRLPSPPELESPARVRSARPVDSDVVLALNSAAFAPIWRYDASTILSWLLTADHPALAEADGEPTGFALTTASRDSELAQLVRIGTAPRFQGRGIGRLMVGDAIRYAASIGADGLSLNTQASNVISRRLYEGLGFRLTGQTVSVMIHSL